MFCHVPEGSQAGMPVVLRPWQKKIIREIYDTPTRQAIISFGRKNGKTSLSAFLCLLHLVGPEAVPNGQLYSAAQSRDQAAVLFSLAAKTVRMSPALVIRIKVRDTAKQLYCEELGTIYRALSAEATTAYGLSPTFIVHDELGQVRGPRFPLYEALETAVGAQSEPLSVVISTQAPTDADLLSLLIDDAKAKHDPKTKLFLWEAPDDADPFLVKTIKQANPAYGDFLNADEVKGQADSAKRMPSRESAFRNLILNQRVNQHDPFVSQSVWKENGAVPREEDFNKGVIAALDLSELVDLTALIYVGQGSDGAWSVGCRFFAPAEGVEERSLRDRAPYDLWANQGFLTLTPGNSISYAFVAQEIAEFCDQYKVNQFTFDRWGMRILKGELAHLGREDIPLDEKGHGQGTQDMTPALINLETQLLNGNVRHGNHPILTWCASNAVAFRGPAGDRKFIKSKSTGRIDGMVALAMAMNRAAGKEKPKESIYKTRGLREFNF